MLNQLNTTTKHELQDELTTLSNRVNTYLDTEQKVGRFGNDDLYQITIDFGGLPNATTKTILTGILAQDVIRIDVLASTKTATGQGYKNVIQKVPNGYVGGGDITFLARIDTNDKIEISITTGSDRTAYNGIVTIQYTKPTQS